MYIIGLCGNSGSGKGTISDFFKKRGFLTIDTDAVYHRLIETDSECRRELYKKFGNEIKNDDGSLNRKKLAQIVFSDKNLHDNLNKIAHHYVLADVRKSIESALDKEYIGVIVDAPMLFESGFNGECDFIVAVIADIETKISRIIARDSISREAAVSRLSHQISEERLIELSDYVIDNSSTVSAAEFEVERVIKEIRKIKQ